MDISRLFTAHKKPLLAVFIILLIAFVLTFPLYSGVRPTATLNYMLMVTILAVSWAMFSSSTGYMSLAPAAFFGIGIYCTALLQDYLPFPVIIIVGGLVSFVLALLLGLVTLRLKGIYFTIFSFGLVVFIGRVIEYAEGSVIGRHGWYLNAIDRTALLYTMLGLTVLTVVVTYLIRHSRLGLAMQSIGGNEEAAEHMGIDITRVKVLTFAISAIFMGAAGVVVAPAQGYSNPSIAFSVIYSFLPIVAALFGGMGTLEGPIIGGLLFGFLDRTLRAEWGNFYHLGFGIIMILVILFMPNGVVGLVPMLRDKLGGVISKLGKGDQT
jgi:branched-chain amino acid transport system permease protein